MNDARQVTDAEFHAADEALLGLIKSIPRLGKTIGLARHGDITTAIRCILEAAASARAPVAAAAVGAETMLRLLQASSCFKDGGVCYMLPCACAESLARATDGNREQKAPSED